MKMKKIKNAAILFLFAVITAAVMCVPAFADIGPKPSVSVKLEGMPEGRTVYATLLSKSESTGPYSFPSGEEYNLMPSDEGKKEAYEKFMSYKDADGYYFIQFVDDCTETHTVYWGYYPPQTFKVLLYFPETDSFAASGVCERYAFDSYFKIDMSSVFAKSDTPTTLDPAPDTVPDTTPVDGTSPVKNVDAVPIGEELTAERDYDYTWETISLVARIVATIAIEVAIAFAFGYGGKKSIALIAVTNAVTQTLLNVALNVYAFFNGSGFMFIFTYVLLELAVFAIEAGVYAMKLRPKNDADKPRLRAVAYAFFANFLSFAAGLLIAKLIPGIF